MSLIWVCPVRLLRNSIWIAVLLAWLGRLPIRKSSRLSFTRWNNELRARRPWNPEIHFATREFHVSWTLQAHTNLMFILLRKQSGSPLPTQNFQNGGNHCGGGLGGMQTLGEQIMLHNSFGGITSILGCRVGLLTDRSNFTNKSCT